MKPSKKKPLEWHASNPCLSDLNGQLMVMAAHRYCLGRVSYIVGAGIEWLWQWRREFEPSTIRIIVRDTVEAIQEDRAGWVSDTRAWHNLAQQFYDEMCEEDQQWVRQAVHQDRDWPLSGIAGVGGQ